MKYRIVILALGTFIIGTDDLVIAGILPSIAHDLEVSISMAGQLVTVFAFAYALGAPVLGTLTAHLQQKKLLTTSILLFSIANGLSVIVPSFGWLFITRILAALSAALFTPIAMTTASKLASQKSKGKALSVITAGLTVGIILGVPIGTWIGTTFGWRITFLFIAIIGIITAIGINWLLPVMEKEADIPLKKRLMSLNTHVMLTLVVGIMSTTGGFMLYTYIAPILQKTTNIEYTMISWFLVLFGIGSIFGNIAGGYGTDRYGAKKTLILSLLFFAMTLFSISLLMLFPVNWLIILLSVLICALCGFAAWALNPALNVHLISLNPKQASMILSFSASSLYLGIGLGALVGGLVINRISIIHIGWVGGVFVCIGLLLFLVIQQIFKNKING